MLLVVSQAFSILLLNKFPILRAIKVNLAADVYDVKIMSQLSPWRLVLKTQHDHFILYLKAYKISQHSQFEWVGAIWVFGRFSFFSEFGILSAIPACTGSSAGWFNSGESFVTDIVPAWQ